MPDFEKQRKWLVENQNLLNVMQYDQHLDHKGKRSSKIDGIGAADAEQIWLPFGHATAGCGNSDEAGGNIGG
jgi:hypothetical protein